MSDSSLKIAFDAAAADFDALGRHLWRPIGEATAEAGGAGWENWVLDACSGIGASAIPAAHRVGPSGRVDAVDISEQMIQQLRQLAGALPQLRAHRADALTWPLRGYDVVQCALGIFFFPDMIAGTERLVEQTRPGGRVVLTIWRGAGMEVPGRHLGRAVAQVKGQLPPQPREPSLYDRINQPEPYAAWLSERGLSEVEVAVHELALPVSDELAWLVITGSGYCGSLDDLNPGQVAAARASYLASLREAEIRTFDATTLIGCGTRVAPEDRPDPVPS